MESFRKEVKELSTSEILLILDDQVDLYTKEELAILREELSTRPDRESLLDNDVDEIISNAMTDILEKEYQQRVEREQKIQREKAKKALDERINNLRAKGCDGYYEYMTLSILDEKGGGLSPDYVTDLLNDYGLDGWHLVSAYANELGHNAKSVGIGGFSTGLNSTVDQHVLILERFIRI